MALKVIFSIFTFFQIPDIQIVVSQPNIITNHASMERLIRLFTLITGFVTQGHI